MLLNMILTSFFEKENLLKYYNFFNLKSQYGVSTAYNDNQKFSLLKPECLNMLHKRTQE